MAGTAYSFIPAASDADGDALSWSATGVPSWATFNPVSGALTGIPLVSGTYSNIVITVTDGEASRTVGPFSILVAPTPGATGSAALQWTAPTQYTDGSALDPALELAGFRIYHGTTPGVLELIAEVDGATTAFTVQTLPAGTHYFAVTSLTHSRSESEYSSVGSKTIS